MLSLIPGFKYDIFISYRQKDNKHDGWVTEFVSNLKGELESTFKEDVSVYFDINPHDGLLETHDVDASLKDKLKCLIFIPIISRTYCDPRSFAWEHEFKTFVEQASKDQFGLKVKLPGGNVASRVLPIQIHELEQEDKRLLEGELGGYIRGIELIYREPGVNRPLKPDDDEKINLNKTKYRNQINKVCNAVKEIITAIGNHEQKHEEIQKEIPEPITFKGKSKNTKIIAGSFILLILIVLGFFFFPKLQKPKDQLKRTIAVLPFINENPSDTNSPIINGISRDISSNLQSIKDLNVVSQYSASKYKDPSRYKIREIAKDLGVNYLVTGTGQKYGTNLILSVELIDAINDRTLWSKPFQQKIRETKDIFSLQSQIAQSVAAELKAIITPEEKQLIEKIPTANLTAYYFYQRGREEYIKYWIDDKNNAALQKAENLYHRALKYDSTFSQAYAGLARVYWFKRYWSTILSDKFLDSVKILCKIAISYDIQLSDAYTIMGDYYQELNFPEKAMEEYNKAISFNPNDWSAFYGRGTLYFNYDFVKCLENAHKVILLNRGPELPSLLQTLSSIYFNYGFTEQGKFYRQEALKSGADSINIQAFTVGEITDLIKLRERVYSKNPDNLRNLWELGHYYTLLRKPEKALKYIREYLQKKTGPFDEINFFGFGRVAWIYQQNGNNIEAEYYLNQQINYLNKLEKERHFSGREHIYYNLSGAYALKGDKKQALKNLERWADIQPVCPLFWLFYLKNDPVLDNIRNEPEFKQILSEMESKYQAEHERVKNWLEENKMF